MAAVQRERAELEAAAAGAAELHWPALDRFTVVSDVGREDSGAEGPEVQADVPAVLPLVMPAALLV